MDWRDRKGSARYWLTPEAVELLDLLAALDQFNRPHRPPEDFR